MSRGVASVLGGLAARCRAFAAIRADVEAERPSLPEAFAIKRVVDGFLDGKTGGRTFAELTADLGRRVAALLCGLRGAAVAS